MLDAALLCKGTSGNAGAKGGASNNHSSRAAVQHNQAIANKSNQVEKRFKILSTGFKLVETVII